MAMEISRFGINNEVVTLDDPQKHHCSTTYIIHALGPSKGPWSYSGKLIPWLKSNLSRFDAIIVHGLWLFQNFGVSKALSDYRRNAAQQMSENAAPKLFIMPHGMLDPYFQRSSSRKLKAIRNWLYWKLIEGKIINAAEGLLFTCKEECRLANEPFTPYQPKNKLIVGLGITAPPAYTLLMKEAFQTKCRGIENHSYILFLGRIAEKKGIDLLLHAYEKLFIHSLAKKKEKLPKLVIAGPGLETSYGKKIYSMVYQNPFLKSSVFFPGMLENESKWGAFYGCEAFVLLSHQENFGIAVVEALACAKPVIISNQINISREINEADAGLIEDDTMEGTLKAFRTWLHMSDHEKLEMRNRARMCFENEFAIGPATSRLLNAIKNNL
ncbi:glycosyltransferase [Pedobacter immunditicola]|uniref:glycosyltransferase n=1 Tax=Pedobacter immunditicola TaxID=3133440 RepID=UPI0030AE1CCD